MTSIERHNYQIAVIVSLVFHGMLLLAFFLLEPKPVALDSYPVGMVEVGRDPDNLPPRPDAITGVSQDSPKNTGNGNPKSDSSKPGTMKHSSEKPLQQQKTNEGITGEKPRTGDPMEDKPTIEPKTETSQIKPGEPGNNSNETKTPPVEEPISFGSGEAMVARLGTLPPYPKNAMNEGKEGEVTVRILVQSSGNLDKVLLLHSSGDSRLDNTTINSITRNWLFKPAAKDYLIDLVFGFNLKSGVTVKFIRSETRK